VHVSHPLEQVVVEAYEVCRFRHFVHVVSSKVKPLHVTKRREARPMVDSGQTIKAGSMVMIMHLSQQHYEGVS
jgi:hypothetical protein